MNIIEHLTKHHNFNQSQIAEAVGVSRAQVSKWKSGETISRDKKLALQELCGAFTDDFDVFKMFGSREEAAYWAETAMEADEWNWLGGEIDDEWVHFNTYQILQALTTAGFISDQESLEAKKEDESFLETFMQAISYTGALDKWVDIYMSDFDSDGIRDITDEIIESLANLSVYHILKDQESLTSVQANFCNSIHEHLSSLIHQYCSKLVHSNLPIMEDYFKVLTDNPEILSDDFFQVNSINEHLPYKDRLIHSELTALRMEVDRLRNEIKELKAQPNLRVIK